LAVTPYVHLTIASTDNIIHPIMRQPTDNGCAVANSRPWKLVTSMVHGARVACRETHLSADWIFKQSRRRRWQITAEREEKKRVSEWVSEWEKKMRLRKLRWRRTSKGCQRTRKFMGRRQTATIGRRRRWRSGDREGEKDRKTIASIVWGFTASNETERVTHAAGFVPKAIG